MARFIKKHEVGASPDELIFRGVKKIDKILIRSITYNSNHLKEVTLSNIHDINTIINNDSITWINIDGLHDLKVLEDISNIFHLNDLVMADVLNIEARPKVTEYDNCLLITLKMLQFNEDKKHIYVENLSIILTQSVVITFQERKGDVFEPIRERIRKNKQRIKNGGTDYLTFSLIDIVVDNYLLILSILGEKIESLEDNLILHPNQSVINKINYYKRELNYLRKNIKPAKEMIFSLTKMESDYISEENNIHYKELQDNISQASDSSDSYREILSDQLNLYHTTITSKLNDIMKFLTVFSVIFIPLTFIAGIYGTNFDNIPELHYKYSYFIMWGVMILIAVLMLLYFRKRKWI